mgnify:CR=1 FL=1
MKEARRVYEFLDIDPDYVSEFIGEKTNASYIPVSRASEERNRKIGEMMDRLGLQGIADGIRKSSWYQSLKNKNRLDVKELVPPMKSQTRAQLTEIFKSDMEQLAEILQRAGRAQIKGVLRSQSTIAGIGNAYSDEILHAARMSPFKPAGTLEPEELTTLYAALRSTLGAAVDRSRGLAASELKGEKKSNLAVHGRTGQACPVCGDTVREVSFADSSLQYCPTCQTGGKPLADRRMSRLLK